ncbi:MAG: hypothetical protein ACTSO7_18765 [Candidatus Heimdallarchaeota archaeon]
MSKGKKKVGRPRKYASNAERSKAYYERKKAKMKDLEEKIKTFEKELVLEEITDLENK